MFRRYEIIPVWNELKKKIKKEDIEWLKQFRVVWEDYSPKNKLDWARNNIGSVRQLVARIRDVLDAKNDRQELPENKVLTLDGLPKSYLLELAEIFGVSHVYANEETPDWKIENAILQSIVRKTGFKPI